MFSLFKKHDDCCNNKHLIAQNLERDGAKKMAMYEWTDGYKAVNRDMTATIGEFKYEVGTEYEFAWEPEVCKSGFHFYKNLDEVISTFPLDRFYYRYFKVKAFYDPNKHFTKNNIYSVSTKYTSKRIILLEEVPFDKVKTHMSSPMRDIIQSEEEYTSINSYDDYRKFAIEKCTNMLTGIYTEVYSRSVIAMMFDLGILSMEKINYMIGLRDEGASTDNIVQIVNKFLK